MIDGLLTGLRSSSAPLGTGSGARVGVEEYDLSPRPADASDAVFQDARRAMQRAADTLREGPTGGGLAHKLQAKKDDASAECSRVSGLGAAMESICQARMASLPGYRAGEKYGAPRPVADAAAESLLAAVQPGRGASSSLGPDERASRCASLSREGSLQAGSRGAPGSGGAASGAGSQGLGPMGWRKNGSRDGSPSREPEAEQRRTSGQAQDAKALRLTGAQAHRRTGTGRTDAQAHRS